MATRTDEPLIVKDAGLTDDDARKAEKLRTDIADTRNHMARTVDAIEDRLSPKNIKAQVSSVKQHLIEEIKDAKSTLKGEVQTELSGVKNKVREATVGRVETMARGARDTVTNAGSTTVDTVKTNPIPAALVAVGLGWLIVSGMKSRRSTLDSRIRARSIDGIDDDGYAYSYDQGVAREHLAASSYGREEQEGGARRVIDRGRRAVSNVGSNVSNVSHDVADRAKNVANDVAERAEHLAHNASNVAHDARHRARMMARDGRLKGQRAVRRAGEGARRMERGFERELKSNPIAFGAVAVAVGAAIGLLLPRTEVEDRLIGEQKDRLLDSAKAAAQDAISSFQEKAGEVTSSLKKQGQREGEGSQLREKKPEQGYANGVSKQNGLPNGVSKHY